MSSGSTCDRTAERRKNGIFSSAALRLSFSESDSSVIEGSGAASVSVTKSGRNQGDVAVTLIPLSLEEARIQYGHSPSSSTDSAESGTYNI